MTPLAIVQTDGNGTRRLKEWFPAIGWVVGLALAGLLAFFALSTRVSVAEVKQNEHEKAQAQWQGDVKDELKAINQKLDKLLLERTK